MTAPAIASITSALDRLAGNGAIGLACSGGGDSLALLLLASDWARARGRDLIVFTVDHGLRSDAAAEVRHVMDVCARLGFDCETLRWETPRAGAGVQARARRARHKLLADACRMRGVTRLMLAHTRDDQAETVGLRLAAGGSWRSAAAMGETAQSPAWPEGRELTLIRPCLGVERSALRQVLRSAGETWVEDPTNQDERYARIRLRNALKRLSRSGFDPGRLAELAGDLHATLDVERRVAFDAAQRAVRIEPWGGAAIDRALWQEIRPAVRQTLLEALVMAVSGQSASPARSQLDPIRAAICAGAPGSGCGTRILKSANGVTWMIRDGGAVRGRVDTRQPDPWSASTDGMRVFDGRFELANPVDDHDWGLLGETYQDVEDRAILKPVPGAARAGLLVARRAGQVVAIAGLDSGAGCPRVRSLLAHRFCRRLLSETGTRCFDGPGSG